MLLGVSMPSRVRKNAPLDAEDSASPKSFAPQVANAINPTAWDQLEKLTKRGGESPDQADAQELLALARASLQMRRTRRRHLPAAMFGEPAWDMLLSLYVGHQSGARQTVSNLSRASGAPASTALRWIDYLEQQKLVTRRPSLTDRRVIFIELTEEARHAVEGFLSDLRGARGTPATAI